MLKRIATSALLVTGMCLITGNAMAGVVNITSTEGQTNTFNGSALQTLLDNATTNPTAGDSKVDVETEFLSDKSDSYWTLGTDGYSGSVSTMVFEFQPTTADYTFGVFDWASGTQLTLFDQATDVGKTVTLTITGKTFIAEASGNTAPYHAEAVFSSATFGYFLQTDNGIVFSDSSKNTLDQKDHMLAYQGKGDELSLNNGINTPTWTNKSYVLAFEDAVGDTGDWNYTDLVVLVNNVSPAPEPATLVLLGTGVAGLTGMVRRRRAMNKYNFNK